MSTLKLTKPIIEAAIVGFESQRAKLDQQIAELMAMLNGADGKPSTTLEAPARKRRKLSAAARKKMAVAQKARWAKARGESQAATAPAKPKRRLSAAGRKAIQEALRRRWAEKKAAESKAAQKPGKKAAAQVTAAKAT